MLNSPKIKVFKTVKETYAVLFENMRMWPKVLAAPFLLYFAVKLLERLIFADPIPQMPLSLGLTAVILFVLGVLAIAMFSVRIPAFVLKQEVPAGPWYQLNIDARVGRFIKWFVIMVLSILLAAGLVAASGFISPVLTVISASILGLAFILALVRVALYPVVIALGEPENPLKASWQLTPWNFWRIFWTLFLVSLPSILIAGISMAIFIKGMANPGLLMQNLEMSFGMLLIMIFIGVFYTLVQYIAISLIYKQLKEARQ